MRRKRFGVRSATLIAGTLCAAAACGGVGTDASQRERDGTGGAGGDSLDVPMNDPPQCSHCAAEEDTTQRGTVVCFNNKVTVPYTGRGSVDGKLTTSSADLLSRLFDCACEQSCAAECVTSCEGALVTSDCDTCGISKCGAELSACLADTGPS